MTVSAEAFCLSLPVVIKAGMDNGRRMIELQASAEVVDLEGDLVKASALRNAAPHFIKSGHLDVDHLSEIGSRLNPPIANPLAYIVGRPVAVTDMGNGNTSVTGELNKARPDGVITKADEVWESLQTDPPAPWRASIFGYPTTAGFTDLRVAKAAPDIDTKGATRYLITEMTWKSLALTMTPMCDGIENTARIVTEKALIKSMIGKSYSLPVTPSISTPTTETLANFVLPPRSRDELLGQFYTHIRKGRCPHSGGVHGNSIHSFREHFANCCGMDPFQADIFALSLMQLLKRERESQS